MLTHKQKENNNDLVIHYKTHRLILGIMGVFLPLALIVGSWIWNHGQIEDSISDYFYTCLRDVFVVTLCAVSIFLLTYKGYGGKDFWASNIAGVFGLITAYVSTNFTPGTIISCHQLVDGNQYRNNDSMVVLSPDCVKCEYEITPVPHAEWLGYVHLGCAAIFLGSLAYIAIKEFTKTIGGMTLKERKKEFKLWKQDFKIKENDPAFDQKAIQQERIELQEEEESIRKKEKENRYYTISGWTIVVMLILLTPMLFVKSWRPIYEEYNLVFWAETVCLFAFGTSWIRKGV